MAPPSPAMPAPLPPEPTSLVSYMLLAAKASPDLYDQAVKWRSTVRERAELPFSEKFNDGSADGFEPIKGNWYINGAKRYRGDATSGNDAVSVIDLATPLPGPLEFRAIVRGKDPGPQSFKNAF